MQEDSDQILEKIGIDLSDKNQPYIFQLIQKHQGKNNAAKKKSSVLHQINQLETPQLYEYKHDNKKEHLQDHVQDFKANPVAKIDQKNPSKISIERIHTEDVFVSQSIGTNLTVNTEALNQCDYFEEVESASES